MPAVEIENLKKTYGDIPALQGISFRIEEGEIFGLLGPNGAGKTTTVEILTGFRDYDEGTVSVFGVSPKASPRALPEILSLAPQQMDFLDNVKVQEILRLFARLHRAEANLPDMIERFHLGDILTRPFHALSGGQRQRLNLAAAFVHRPRLILLDEPTAGLDPQTRVYIHDLIRDLRREGRTVILTTHYIEEAERLCDRVAIIDHGRIIALDTPSALVRRVGGRTRVEIELSGPAFRFPELPEAEALQPKEGFWVCWVQDPAAVLAAIHEAVRRQGCRLRRLSLYPPTLEDVFIQLTGRRFRD